MKTRLIGTTEALFIDEVKKRRTQALSEFPRELIALTRTPIERTIAPMHYARRLPRRPTPEHSVRLCSTRSVSQFSLKARVIASCTSIIDIIVAIMSRFFMSICAILVHAHVSNSIFNWFIELITCYSNVYANFILCHSHAHSVNRCVYRLSI